MMAKQLYACSMFQAKRGPDKHADHIMHGLDDWQYMSTTFRCTLEVLVCLFVFNNFVLYLSLIWLDLNVNTSHCICSSPLVLMENYNADP